MAGNQFACVGRRTLVYRRILAFVQQQVVSYPTADEALLDTGQGIYGMVDVQQRTMVGIQVRAYLRVDARRALAALAEGLVFSVHAVHVGRRSTQVTQVAFEIRHFRDGFYFL